MRILLFFIWTSGFFFTAAARVIVPDFRVNDVNQNFRGVGRTAVAAAANGNYAIAWQDSNDYTEPVAEIPRVVVLINKVDSLGHLRFWRFLEYS